MALRHPQTQFRILLAIVSTVSPGSTTDPTDTSPFSTRPSTGARTCAFIELLLDDRALGGLSLAARFRPR